MTKVIIPKEIYHSFFFPENHTELELEQIEPFNAKDSFVYEIAFFSGIETVQPWEDPERYLPQLLTEWKLLQEDLKSIFQKRDKANTLIPMKLGIGYLLESIYWSNGLPVSLGNSNDLDTLAIRPVNITERVQFLFSRPGIYPSFIQLTELIEEQEKQFSKYLAIQRAKTK